MRKIKYNAYLDKVYGCWLGKCISGTVGAPFEGMKEIFDYKFNSKAIEIMLENDDLDLQVLWLDVLEEKGVYITSDDLAKAFVEKCPYDLGEYAYFKKNYKRGIHPPLSGVYNNRYYIEGMGCAIRSEIWGCICPGNGKLASEYALKDGILDHGIEAVYAEQFFAGLEAEAFFESDIMKLFNKGLSLIPRESKISKCIRDVTDWCSKGLDWRYVRGMIINRYGHPDCTNMYQNIGFTLLALIYGKGDFIDTIMLALNCGYDTDCTCATAGAVLGIIYGGDCLANKHNLKDTGYKLGVNVTRASNSIFDLAVDVCRAGITVFRTLNTGLEITDIPADYKPLHENKTKALIEMWVEYDGQPVIGIGENKRIILNVRNNSDRALNARIRLQTPETFTVDAGERSVMIPVASTSKVEFIFYVSAEVDMLNETNLIDAVLMQDDTCLMEYRFGIVGAAVWKMYGPFWDNVVDVPHIELGESYFKHIKGKNENETIDLLRDYHLNAAVDLEKAYMPEEEIADYKEACDTNPSINGTVVQTYEDRILLSDLVGLQGPCAVYLVRHIYLKEDMAICVNIGHSDAFKLWINGKLAGESKVAAWWTAENKHILNYRLKKGVNKIVVKLLKHSGDAEFSMIFGTGGLLSAHLIDLASVNIK